MMRSIQPVFDLESGGLIEVFQISCEHGGIVFERNAGDAKIERTDGDTLASHRVENVSGVFSPRQNRPTQKVRDAVLKLPVGSHTAILLPVRLDGRQPSLQHFFSRDDREKLIVIRIQQTLPQPASRFTLSCKFGIVVCVKNQHQAMGHLLRFRHDSLSRATQLPAGSLHRNARHPSCSRSSSSIRPCAAHASPSHASSRAQPRSSLRATSSSKHRLSCPDYATRPRPCQPPFPHGSRHSLPTHSSF